MINYSKQPLYVVLPNTRDDMLLRLGEVRMSSNTQHFGCMSVAGRLVRRLTFLLTMSAIIETFNWTTLSLCNLSGGDSGHGYLLLWS